MKIEKILNKKCDIKKLQRSNIFLDCNVLLDPNNHMICYVMLVRVT